MTSPSGSGSFYDDPASVDAYLAHRHAAVTSPNLVMEEPAFTEVVGDLAGLTIIDLGCGDGSFGQTCLAARAARYVGIDSSQPMIDRARDKLSAPNASFTVASLGDAEIEQVLELERARSAEIDLVTARMALHYLGDLSALFASVARALRPGGRLVFSVVHPVVTAPAQPPDGPRTSVEVDDYFVSGPRSRSWFGKPVTWQHRTIEEYIRALTAAGFVVDDLRECAPVEELFQGDTNEYERRRRVPLFLLIAASKPHAP